MQGMTSCTIILISDWIGRTTLSDGAVVLYLESSGWKYTIYDTDWRLLCQQ